MPVRRKQFLETGEVTARVNFIKFMLLISLNIVSSSVPSKEWGARGFAKLALRPKRAVAPTRIQKHFHRHKDTLSKLSPAKKLNKVVKYTTIVVTPGKQKFKRNDPSPSKLAPNRLVSQDLYFIYVTSHKTRILFVKNDH
ncbi:hypothetical protein WN51_03492 [Melipona quadrifasciata]|uniref:Uncharacterized protein n=1 Tax=Melipona quadrifasciata TaxID=166423 RepID=A0A0N0U4D5_9HYME|nr:hypothetical protein WN51_03492 [Melipona quadrifasciata]